MNFSNSNRHSYIQQLTSRTFDVLIIGSGVSGAGIAFDAALRGMRVALVDMQDFAAGTSSRSTKLIHGGLRYLKQFEIRLVAEVGKEREIVYKNGPHVTTPEWMLLPFYKKGSLGRFSTSIGLTLYDFLASVKRNERRKMLSPQECLEKVPNLRSHDLLGGGYYVEYRTDDARLTIEVVKAASEIGAICVNYIEIKSLQYDESMKVNGAIVLDRLSGNTYTIKAKKVVNATGPWVDRIREMDGTRDGKSLQLTKGVHLVFDQKFFPLKQAVYFDAPDGRMIFAIPREGKTYIGTTDTLYDHDPISPIVTYQDCQYLLSCIQYMFPSLELNVKKIESKWAGVRPLILEEGKNPSEISRKDEIWESETGLITIAGGKLTGYRKMAETVVDLLVKRLKDDKDSRFHSCQTKDTPISGGHVGNHRNFSYFVKKKAKEGLKLGFTYEEAKHLATVYGSNVTTLYHYMINNLSEGRQSSLPNVLWVKLKYALEHEMVATPLDFFFRRTGALLFHIDSVELYKTEVIQYMMNFFQWSDEQKKSFSDELENAIKEAVLSTD
jgi:glycerol-3-phosphate dehydrogenase